MAAPASSVRALRTLPMATICRPRMSMETVGARRAESSSSMMTRSAQGMGGTNSAAIIDGMTHTGRATWTSRGWAAMTSRRIPVE